MEPKIYTTKHEDEYHHHIEYIIDDKLHHTYIISLSPVVPKKALLEIPATVERSYKEQ